LHQTLFFCMGCWSAPKVNTFKTSECAQCECASVPAYFSWSFLRPNCQNAPNVNLLVLLHFLAGHFCAQSFRVHPMCMRQCCHILSLAISVPKLSECGQLNVLVLPHFLAGHFCAKIVRVHPMWMHRCCCIFYLAISALKLSQSTQYECIGVAAFSTGSFACPNFQSVPNVNLLVLLHFLVGYFCA